MTSILDQNRRQVEMYHSGTAYVDKKRILKSFSENRNIKVLICTVAFGMGVNIPDIDRVVHWGASKSPLDYWQEVGRLGRDGRNGVAVLLGYPRGMLRERGSEIENIFRKIFDSGTCLRKCVLKDLYLDEMGELDESERIVCVSDNDCEGESCCCAACNCC